MSYQNMTVTMKTTKPSSKCQFTTIILLSIIWTILLTEANARPNFDKLLSKQNDVRVSELYLDELLANAKSDKFVHDLTQYHPKQPNYLDKWPNLRDLVLTVDYDDSSALESNDISNTKFFERLYKLAASTAESFDDIRDDNLDTSSMPMKTLKSTSTNQITYKDRNIKKNIQYMSPCHFKICNMGRKRNARLLTNN